MTRQWRRNAQRLQETRCCGCAPGTYKILVEKQGFYTTAVAKLEIAAGQQSPVEVKLQPVREYKEEIEVTAQASPIDPQETSSAQAITANDISRFLIPPRATIAACWLIFRAW